MCWVWRVRRWLVGSAWVARSSPVANVVATPIIGGQWVTDPTGKYKLDFVLCENSADPNVPIAAKLNPYTA